VFADASNGGAGLDVVGLSWHKVSSAVGSVALTGSGTLLPGQLTWVGYCAWNASYFTLQPLNTVITAIRRTNFIFMIIWDWKNKYMKS